MGFAAIAGLIGTGISAASAMEQGRQQKQWMNYQAQQHEADARAEKAVAAIHADKIRKLAKRTAGEARAALSASGVSGDEGTALNINSEIYANAEEDATMALFGGADRSRRLDAEAQGSYLRGNQAMSAAKVNATSTVLGGASSAYSGWRRQQPPSGGAQ